MSDIKLGITAWSLPCAARDSIKMAADWGFGAIQLDLGSSEEHYPLKSETLCRAYADDARLYGVKILSVVLNDLCKAGFVHSKDDPRTARAYHTLHSGVAAAAQIGAGSICIPSFFDNAIHDELEYSRTVETLRYVCELVSMTDILVYSENVLGENALTDFFADVNMPNLRLLYDTQNYSFMAGLDAREVLDAHMDKIGGFVHVKDGATGLGQLPLGEGNSDVWRTVQGLRGYEGWIVLENRYGDVEGAKRDVAALKERL